MRPINSTLSPGQLIIVVVQSQIGISILYMPSSVESIAGSDAWISMLLAGVAATALIGIMWLLSSRFPNSSCASYMPRLLGRAFGFVGQLAFAAMFVFNCSLVLVLFADVVRDWLLPETPEWVVVGLMLFTGAYLGRENIRTIARFGMATFGLILLLLGIAAYAFKNAELLYILPIGEAGLPNIGRGLGKAFYSLFGFEILLFVFPFVQGGRRAALKAMLYANLFSTFVYALLLFICLIVFSPEELRIIPQPVLYMIKALSFTVIERADLYFLSFWAIIVISTVASYVYLYGNAFAALVGKQEHRGVVPFVSIVVFAIALVPNTQPAINALQAVVNTLGWTTIAALPILMLAISYMRNIKEKEAESK